MPRTRDRAIPVVAALVVGIGTSAVLAACQAGPVDAFPTGPRPTVSATPTTPTPSSATSPPLPSSCSDLFPSALAGRLQSSLGPLNADGFELVSTQNGDALDILRTAPTLRCTWGTPGEDGLSTNVTAVDLTQQQKLVSAFTTAGYACSDADGGTVCSFEQKTVTLDDRLVTRGEDQYVGRDHWIATAWVGHLPEDYTRDLAAALPRPPEVISSFRTK